jgi:hypothetical protein
LAATDSTTLPDGTGVFTRWESIVGIRNATSAPASVTLIALHGNGAQLGDPSECRNVISLPAQTGRNVVPCILRYPNPGVAMLVMRATPGVLFGAEVQKVRFRCGCAISLDCTPIPQGQATVPVFRGLFPSGATAISGPVELGNFQLPSECASTTQQYRRRVNVTLFNGGDSTATFRVWETPNHFSSETLYSREVTVGPKEVLQLNSFPVPTTWDLNLTAVNGGNRIWINVTADQPFLSYVSTVFDDPEAGALPFQVYPGAIPE